MFKSDCHYFHLVFTNAFLEKRKKKKKEEKEREGEILFIDKRQEKNSEYGKTSSRNTKPTLFTTGI